MLARSEAQESWQVAQGLSWAAVRGDYESSGPLCALELSCRGWLSTETWAWASSLVGSTPSRLRSRSWAGHLWSCGLAREGRPQAAAMLGKPLGCFHCRLSGPLV